MTSLPRWKFESLGSTLRGQALQNAAMDRFAPSGDFAPADYIIHGGTSDMPGTWPANTPIKSGDITYSRAGRTVTGFVDLQFKSATLWSGVLFFEMPFQFEDVFGQWEATDSSGGPAYVGGSFVVYVPSTGPYIGLGMLGLGYRTANPGTLNAVSDSVPWAWANNDRIVGGFVAKTVVGT